MVLRHDNDDPLCPIDFHCHGVGRFDFTDPPELSLDAVERSLAAAMVRAILTIYVPRQHFASFLDLVRAFEAGRRNGTYRYILGIASEGPLLASHGGTPAKGVWSPSRIEWQALAALGDSGLRYVVISPDATPAPDAPSVEWIAECLLEGGVLPALGHFRKEQAEASAAAVERVLRVVERRNAGPIVTDHLYNDMPRNFRHAWRTASERARREHDLEQLDLPSWSVDRLETILGPVPAAILRGALRGLVKVCLNFDGEHVDLAISKRTVEIIGSRNFMLMTDRIESRVLAGQRLRARNDSTLLYQSSNIVAGGSQSVRQQLHNMRLAGFDEATIRDVAVNVPAAVLRVPAQFDGGIAEASLLAVS